MSAARVTRHVASSEPHNLLGRDVEPGEMFYTFHQPTYGAVDDRHGLALSERDGEAPFFEFPRDAVEIVPATANDTGVIPAPEARQRAAYRQDSPSLAEILDRSADVAAGCLKASQSLLRLAEAVNDRTRRRQLRLAQAWENLAADPKPPPDGGEEGAAATKSTLRLCAGQLRDAVSKGAGQ